MKKLHFPSAYSMMTSPDDTLVYLMDKSTIVKHRETGKTVERLTGTSNSYGCVSPNGQYAAFLSTDGILRLFEIGTPHKLCIKNRVDKSSHGHSLGFCENGKYVIAGGKQNIYIFSVPDGRKELFTKLPEEHFCTNISILGSSILITSIRTINATEPTCLYYYRSLYEKEPIKFAISSTKSSYKGHLLDGSHMYIARDIFEDGIRYYTIDENTTFENPDRIVEMPTFGQSAFSPDQKFFSMLQHDPDNYKDIKAQLYRTDTWQLLEEIDIPYIWRVGFSASSKYWLVSASYDSRVVPLEVY